MNLEQVKQLKGGTIIRSGETFGVIVSRNLTSKVPKNFISIQWFGGGCSMWIDNEPRQWEDIELALFSSGRLWLLI